MQIVYVCGYNDSVSGGVQNVVPQYIRNMSVCADIIALNLGGAMFEVPEGVKVFYNERNFWEQVKEIDLVVFHEVYYLKYYSLARRLYRMHIPYIIIPHGSLVHGAQSQKKYIKRIFNFLWVNKFAKQASAIQFLSKGESNNSIYSEFGSLILPNGIDLTEAYKICDTQRKGMKLVFIGRLSIFYKGLDLLLGACRLIKAEMLQNHILLDIYGTDFAGGRKELENLVEKFELNKCVTIHDGVFDKKKEEILLESDIFIQTSRSEGQPMGILEAMQIGMPLIITPGTTFGEIVENAQCGWSVQENFQSIADGILKAFSDKTKWSVFGNNARELVRTNYSWNAVREKTYQEYQKRILG